MIVETNWYDKKISYPSSLGLDFTLVPSADRANVVYRDLYGYHGGYFEVLFAFVVGLVSFKPQVICYWSSKKHSYVIFSMVRRVRRAENSSQFRHGSSGGARALAFLVLILYMVAWLSPKPPKLRENAM